MGSTGKANPTVGSQLMNVQDVCAQPYSKQIESVAHVVPERYTQRMLGSIRFIRHPAPGNMSPGKWQG